MNAAIKKGYKVKISRWRFYFVRQVGLRWTCECADFAFMNTPEAFYECTHIRAVKHALAAQYRGDAA